MGMDSQVWGFSDYPTNGYPSINGFISPGFDESLNYTNLFNYKDPTFDLTSLNLPNAGNFSTSLDTSPEFENSRESDDSDDVLKYISTVLMEENLEEVPCMFQDSLALQVAEKPFYDALGKKYPPSPNQHPLIEQFVESPDGHNNSRGSSSEDSGGKSISSTSSTSLFGSVGVGDFGENKEIFVKPPAVESISQPFTFSEWSFSSSSVSNGATNTGVVRSSLDMPMDLNIFSDRDSMIQFQKGVEEASKFLPKSSNLVIDLENITFPDETEKVLDVSVKKEKEDPLRETYRGRKVHYLEDEDLEAQGRSSKQSAGSVEEAELSDIFDKVLLCPHRTQEACASAGLDSRNEATWRSELNGPLGGFEGGKARSKKSSENSKSVVDLRTLLVHCAQAVASDDHRTADELLKQIRCHSSSVGDGSQRLVHYFANALEARLAGTGSQIYTALSSKRTTAAEILKAYQVFVCACPFKRASIAYSNDMILKMAKNASKLHIIDFGILYGFQWPVLIQRLSDRASGPPKLRITGIDLPLPGFRPAERVEATGSRLAKYCERFNVPFEYHAIAQSWETIKLEDLKIRDDEFVAVNCPYRFKNLLDETVVLDSPRHYVLDLIRKIKPDIFVHGVVNGSYNAPFFVTRFREVLFHYSALFDMFDTTVSQEDPERKMFEKEFYGREIMNVIACEGTERVERPETYKQWQVRNTKAGFRQLPLDMDLIKKMRTKVKRNYHKDFVIDLDGHWALHGWKGRITCALSAWVPS